jgi:hypothetical protein
MALSDHFAAELHRCHGLPYDVQAAFGRHKVDLSGVKCTVANGMQSWNPIAIEFTSPYLTTASAGRSSSESLWLTWSREGFLLSWGCASLIATGVEPPSEVAGALRVEEVRRPETSPRSGSFRHCTSDDIHGGFVGLGRADLLV